MSTKFLFGGKYKDASTKLLPEQKVNNLIDENQKIEERETKTVESNKSDKKYKMQEKELKRIMQS